MLTKTLNQKRVFDQWLELNYGRIDIYHYTPPFSSPPPEHDLSVLDRFPKDSYQRFMAEDQLLSVNRIRRKNLAAYAKYMQDEETKQQDRLNEQKLQKIMKLLLCLQELEKVLLDHGAKTYEELFPHMGPQFKDTVEEEVKDDEFKAQFIFQGVVTEGLTNAYIELYVLILWTRYEDMHSNMP